MYRQFVKGTIDKLVVLCALFALLPLFATVAVLIVLEDRGPVFYSQWRLGKHGRTIKILKFRSMVHAPRVAGAAGEILAGNRDVTKVGHWIRRLKIDELPQLFSVLVGDMALVGPRPCLVEQREQLDEYGQKRLLVVPGCTGLAQVHGNIHLSWPERWKYDAYYVDHMSLSLDCWILWKTVGVVLFGEKRLVMPFSEFLQESAARERPV